MGIVQSGRKWNIQTKEDYDRAMAILKDNDFCAEMSDDFSVWQREKAEVAAQMAQVKAQAKERGII